MRHRRGFTLVELLVIIGIILVLVSLLMTTAGRMWRTGDRTRVAADLAAIGAALEAYRQDHGMYPPVPAVLWTKDDPSGPTDYRGARTLCRALIGPGPEVSTAAADVADGKGPEYTDDPSRTDEPERRVPGAGFRKRKTPGADGELDTLDDVAQGQAYGPYIAPDKFKTADPSTPQRPQPGYWALLDRNDKPVLYYPAAGKPNVRLPNGYIGDRGAGQRPMFSFADNLGEMTLAKLAPMMGDANANGTIDPGETPAHEGPYVLWAAGPDEDFGPDVKTLGSSTDPAVLRKAVERSDDVTNFR